MDLLDIKARVAEAVVESILRRAGYKLTPFPRAGEGVVLRIGREDFTPHFTATQTAETRDDRAVGAPPSYLIAVKYRGQLGQYLAIEGQRGDRSTFAQAKRLWPALCFVFVTDRPDPGRSFFQVLDLRGYSSWAPVRTRDLAEHKGLAIWQANVDDHEELARRIFALLTGG